MRIVETLPFLGLTLAGGLVLAAACTPADVSGPAEQTCQAYAYAYCEQLQACSSTFITVNYASAGTCEAMIKGTCFNELTAPSAGPTTSQRQACTQAISQGAWGCTDILVTQNPPTACEGMPGGLANGQPCGVRTQCHSGFCAFSPGQGCGTCADPPALGAPCNQGLCVTGNVCVPSTQICAAHAGQGSPCENGLPCDDGLNCSYPVGSATGTCELAVTKANAACVFNGGGCSLTAGLACNASSSTCQAARLASPGEACGTVGDQMTTCAIGNCVHGACVARPALGAPCDVDGPACATAGICVSADGGTAGTCQLHSADFCP